MILYLRTMWQTKMKQKYLLDTNAYFNLLKLLRKYNENSLEYPESIKQLFLGEIYISTVTKVEIISVLGKYARGNNGGINKCNCVIAEDGTVCSNYKYTSPRKKWNKKLIKAWLQLIDETITGSSTLLQLDLLPFTEKTIEEAQRVVVHALVYNFGSMDSIIAATAKESIDKEESIIVITSDKGLKACLKQCNIPSWDLLAQVN